MTITALFWSLIAVTGGAFIQGSTGMGFALIVVPVLGLLAPALLPITVLLLMLPLNAQVFWRERHAVDFTGVSWITVGRVAGALGGVLVLMWTPTHYLNMLIGGVTLAAVVTTLVAPAFVPGRSAYVSTGVVAGVMETATGIGGPPLALIYQHTPVSVLRASVALCFLVGEIVSIALLVFAGRFDPEKLEIVTWLVPGLFVGMLSSQLIHTRINERFLRSFVLVFAAVSALAILVKG